jgi:hypothetical protein
MNGYKRKNLAMNKMIFLQVDMESSIFVTLETLNTSMDVYSLFTAFLWI